MSRWQLGMSLVCAAVLGGVGVTLVTPRRSVATVERRDDQLGARMAALESSADAAKARIAMLERQARAPSVSVSTAPVEEKRPTEVERPGIRTGRELAEAYEGAFAAEAVDLPWAREAQPKYRTAIDAQLPESSRVVSFECRAEFCKLDVVHRSIASSNGFLKHLFAAGDGALKGMSGGFRAGEPTPTDDGGLRYSVYIAKPGAQLALEP